MKSQMKIRLPSCICVVGHPVVISVISRHSSVVDGFHCCCTFCYFNVHGAAVVTLLSVVEKNWLVRNIITEQVRKMISKKTQTTVINCFQYLFSVFFL